MYNVQGPVHYFESGEGQEKFYFEKNILFSFAGILIRKSYQK